MQIYRMLSRIVSPDPGGCLWTYREELQFIDELSAVTALKVSGDPLSNLSVTTYVYDFDLDSVEGWQRAHAAGLV